MTSHEIQKTDPLEQLASRFCSTMRVFQAAAIYFALVFGIGFILGLIRVLWVASRVGEQNAELVESPLMLIAVFLAARWMVRHFSVAAVPINCFGIGIVALALLLVAEVAGILWLRGISISEYVQRRDPVSGTVYVVMLAMFALMPWLVARRLVDRAARESSATL